jgi:hypothetical protein
LILGHFDAIFHREVSRQNRSHTLQGDPTLEQKIALKGVAAGTAKVNFNRRQISGLLIY